MRYFPHITRINTAAILKPAREITFAAGCLVLILINSMTFYQSRNKSEKTEGAVLSAEKKATNAGEIAYWEKLSKDYPEYNYAYLKLEKLYENEGKTEEANLMQEKYETETFEN